MFLYSYQRLVYLWWNWHSFSPFSFAEILNAFIFGLRYDLSAISTLLVLTSPFIFFLDTPLCARLSSRTKFSIQLFLIILANLPFFVLNGIDAEMVDIVGQRFNEGALYNFGEVPGKTSSFLVYYWPLFLSCVFALGVLIFGSILVRRFSKDQEGFSFLRKAISLIILFLAVRGGPQPKPLNISYAAETKSPLIYQLTVNTTFNFIESVWVTIIPKKSPAFVDAKAANSPEYQPIGDLNQALSTLSSKENLDFSLKRPLGKQNVVLIILESFNLDYMGSVNSKEGYTPFLDELSQKGILLTNNFANARRSIDGVAATLGGIPSFYDYPYVISSDVNSPFEGIGSILKEKGYHTGFYHGARNGTMKFDVMMKKFGIDKYAGLNEYPHPEDHDGVWGISDHKYLSYVADEISQTEEPFFVTTFTLSSHHPFKVPDEFKGKFPKGHLDIHESIGYTDYSLRQFFKKIEKLPWYEHTLFILTADHTYKSNVLENQSYLGRFRTPLILFHPQMNFSRMKRNHITQQADVVPTILDFLQVDPPKDQVCFGKSVFKGGPRAVVNYVDRRHLLITDEVFASSFEGQPLEVYNIEDSNQRNPLKDFAHISPLTEVLTSKITDYYRYFKLSKTVPCR
jgi:phosphoglycerol transferase MdoB-like AlkP superfamily enzyme